jgi:CheY-like chemotaxis protein
MKTEWSHFCEELSQFIQKHGEIRLIKNITAIPENRKIQFYSLFNKVRSAFITNWRPNFSIEIDNLRRSFAHAETKLIARMKLKNIERTDMPSEYRLLRNKRILIVDDEPDVLETLEDLLPMCQIQKAGNYTEAKKLLEEAYFDMAILDIMGVDGYKLLKLAQEKNVIGVMLTAHALNIQNIKRSYREGAASYLPKEEMLNISTYLNDILEAKEQGKHLWWRWFDRLGAYFSSKFGPNWEQEDKEFLDKLKYHDPTL